MSSIVAAYDKTLFYNETSKYCVFRLKTADPMVPEDARDRYRFADHLIRFVAVGYDLPRTDAIKMELDGNWVNGKYGPQFKVDSWHELVPPTIEGILGYLSSGLLKGIGPKTAGEIVQRFGTDSLRVIENQPEKLLEIRGITEERLEEIKAGYAKSKAIRDIMTVLAPFKITPKTAMRIYEHFGPDGAALLRKSFYQLCQVPGFGFRKVDAIALESGGNLQDPMRIRGALFYALEKSRIEGGHLYSAAETLLGEGLTLLNEKIPQIDRRLKKPQLGQELLTAVKNNVVVSKQGNIYLPHVFNQESETARKVAEMLLYPPEPVVLGPVLEKVKGTLGITLSPRQQEGVEMVFRHSLSIITGGPGTGKSTILKAVIEAYQLLYPDRQIALGAPTGKASRRMAETTGINTAATLHSLLGLHGEDSGWQEKRPLEADFLIVDEASMVDMWLAHQMFTRLKKGAKVLIVGDADQLESVGAGSVFRELIQCGLVPVTVLNQIFRQAEDSRIAYNAKFIKEGTPGLYYGPDFAFVAAEDEEQTADLVRRIYRRALKTDRIEQVQILSPFRTRGETSANSLNTAIQAEINPPDATKPELVNGGRLFRLGDRVMVVKNDYDVELFDQDGKQSGKGVFNGEVGIVSGVDPGALTICFDGRYANCPLESLDELELAYATTIHKSQGSEYDTVIIPMLPSHKILLTRNLFYTAITRAKQRVALVGMKTALYMAVRKDSTGKRNTLLGERIQMYYEALARQNGLENENKLKNAS